VVAYRKVLCQDLWTGIAQSVLGLATDWTVRGSNPGARRDFLQPSRPASVAHPASYTTGTGSFSGVKRPKSGVDHQPPSSAEVRERVELYIYLLWAFVACPSENFTFTFTFTKPEFTWRDRDKIKRQTGQQASQSRLEMGAFRTKVENVRNGTTS
jgi:hypothetical protein